MNRFIWHVTTRGIRPVLLVAVWAPNLQLRRNYSLIAQLTEEHKDL
jgi:predicted GNAT superfamily acetyltransferase